ncbi:MAG: hemolysin family protein [Cyanobacteria bacterium P01_F01_bin.150]
MDELTGSDILPRLLAVVVLIVINAFFVTAEFSIVSVRRSRIQQLSAEGDRAAKAVQSLQRHIDRLLSTTQLGITLSSLALGWIGQDALAQPLAFILLEWLNLPFGYTLAHSISITITFCLIAYLQLVLGELCPKSVALIYAEDLSRLLAPPSVVIARSFKPLIWLLNQSTRWILRRLGVQYDSSAAYNRLTPEELQLIISTSTESSGLEADERERLTNLFEFGDATAAEVMVPRTQMVALNATDTVKHLLEELSKSGYSRYPVIDQSLDEVKGIIYFKDVAEALSTEKLDFNNLINPWVIEPQFIPETMVLSDVLEAIQKTGQAMLIVVDEFGGTAGLITLQDLINEILGDHHDVEHSTDQDWQRLDDETVLIQAQMPLDEVNDILRSDFPITDDYHTLAGFMIYHLQTIPDKGATLRHESWELTLVEAEDNRLHKIQVRSRPEVKANTSSSTVLLDATESEERPALLQPAQPMTIAAKRSAPQVPLANGVPLSADHPPRDGREAPAVPPSIPP